MKLSATPVRNDVAPPLLGQHTDEVLGEVLGYSDGKIQQLRQASII
jgi:crotonobetainyl-CoA:carnitine CoA-transferase CaiB-like acyl-CoA transferase